MLRDPYLWVHIAGLMMLPLAIAVVVIGLGLGVPLPLGSLELFLVILLGGLPVWVMQILRPWNPFNLLLLQLRPNLMSDRQRQILRLILGMKQPILNGLAAIVLSFLLWKLADYAPLTVGLTRGLLQWRILGLAIATVGVFLSNLLVQVPLNFLLIIWVSEKTLEDIDPLPPERVKKEFMSVGIPVGQLLPRLY